MKFVRFQSKGWKHLEFGIIKTRSTVWKVNTLQNNRGSVQVSKLFRPCMFWPLDLFVTQLDTLSWKHARLEFRRELRQRGSNAVTTWRRLGDRFLYLCAHPSHSKTYTIPSSVSAPPPALFTCETETSLRVSHFHGQLAFFSFFFKNEFCGITWLWKWPIQFSPAEIKMWVVDDNVYYCRVAQQHQYKYKWRTERTK
jgi:hypothetical protein